LRKRLVLVSGADRALLDRLSDLVLRAAADFGSAIVHTTSETEDACLLLGTVRPDLVVLGVGAASADGGLIARMLRQTPTLRKAPVLTYGPGDATPQPIGSWLGVPFADDAAVAEMRRLLEAGVRAPRQS